MCIKIEITRVAISVQFIDWYTKEKKTIKQNKQQLLNSFYFSLDKKKAFLHLNWWHRKCLQWWGQYRCQRQYWWQFLHIVVKITVLSIPIWKPSKSSQSIWTECVQNNMYMIFFRIFLIWLWTNYLIFNSCAQTSTTIIIKIDRKYK